MLDRLRQERIDVVLEATHPIGRLADRSQHDDRHLREMPLPTHLSHQHESVDVRHLDVGDQDVEGMAPFRGRAESRHRRRGNAKQRRRENENLHRLPPMLAQRRAVPHR